ncbi:hypothetical protein MAN_06213, partial [Metarhizium hybridum]
MKALGCLRCILHLITSAVDKGRVSNEIRRGEDLLQACYRDLQHLIDLRNQHLEFLETAPRHILERINAVIDLANKGLIEGRRIIEKCRPKAHRGMKMTLHSRIEWSLRSSVDFHRQESVIIRDNAAVLAELNYLRQITAWTLPGNMATTRNDPDMPLRNGQRDTKTSMTEPLRHMVRKRSCYRSGTDAGLKINAESGGILRLARTRLSRCASGDESGQGDV